MLYHNSHLKIKNVNRTIEALLGGNFPLTSGKEALETLKVVFEELASKLDRAHALGDETSEKQLAYNVSVKIIEVLPILGFIQRSTSVNNAFEFLDPLQSIADAVLHGKPRLLLSSEWDYIPFAYPQSLEDLRGFVLIGMPASEAGGSLLIPLAGHELGHAVWRNRGHGGGAAATLQYHCEQLYAEKDNALRFRRLFPNYDPKDIVQKEVLPDTIAASVEYAVCQAEELFCDMFSYSLFGESYLYAFSYILAPGFRRMSGSKHPSYKTRVAVLRDIAEKEGVQLPDLQSLHFSDEGDRGSPAELFVVEMGEASVAKIVHGLWSLVSELIKSSGISRPTPALAIRHLKQFRLGIPAGDPRCLGDIIVSGWMFYKELQASRVVDKLFFGSVEHLNEMILKTVEVLEYNRRTV